MGRIGVLQMTSTADVEQNLNSLEQFFQKAQSAQVEVILLPENFALMGLHETDKCAIAEKSGSGLIQDTIAQLAAKYGVWVIAGTIPIRAGENRIFARSMVFNSQGFCVAWYDKIHLFDVILSDKEHYQESATIEPGHQVVVVDTPIARIGLSVCYDVRFPELYRQMVLAGAELFTIPAAFTHTTGQAHWEVLLRARAIEHVSYVVAANQVGVHDNGRATYGHSMIVDPWGRVLDKLTDKPGLAIAEINRAELHALRKRFPCNDHHKIGIKNDEKSKICA